MTSTNTPDTADSSPSTPGSSVIRLLLVDDHPIMLRALTETFDGDDTFEVMATATHGLEALDVMSEHTPDLLLTDLDMPEMNGVELIRAVTENYPEVPALALTTFSSLDWVIEALRAGASGYLLKDAAPEEIIAGCHHILNNEMVLSQQISALLAETIATSPLPGFTGGRPPGTNTPVSSGTHASPDAPELTRREQEVLDLLAGGLNNKEIAAELFISESAVKLHIGKACDRLGARDRVQLLVRAFELGIVTPSLLKPETSQDRYL